MGPVFLGDMAHVAVMSQQTTTSGFIRAILQRTGHRVSVATSALEGHRMLQEDDVHLVFIDLNMPACHYLDTIVTWKETFPTLRIISLSWPNTIVDFMAIRMMGAYDVLQMPVGGHELLHAVQCALTPDVPSEALRRSGNAYD